MFSYENGVAVAFLLWLFNAVWLIVQINSRLERNLNKIGQRLSWLTLSPKLMSLSDANRSLVWSIFRYVLVVAFGLPFVLLSWLYVACAVGMFIYMKSKDAGAPQSVREFRWKLRNIDMTFDQLVKELMKVDGLSEAKFDECRSAMASELRDRGLRSS